MEKSVFISTYQIIIFQINIIESTSRSRSNQMRQKSVVMKSRCRSPINVDTQNDKLKNATKKINLSNIEEELKSNCYESSKSERDWDSSKSNNEESPITKQKELQNWWSQYFREEKTGIYLIKERPPFLLKRKLSIIFSKDSERNEYIPYSTLSSLSLWNWKNLGLWKNFQQFFL